MINLTAIAGLAIALISPPTAPAVGPPSGKITVDVVAVNGSGCPAGTTALAVSPDNTAFTVTYSQYLAEAGGGSKATDARKNCQLTVKVNYPAGFTYAIAQVDNRGFGHIVRGASAIQRSNYYFQGKSSNQTAVHQLPSPLDDNWQTTDVADMASLVFAPCGEQRNLNINTELRVNAGSSRETSYVSMDSTDGAASTVFHFSWMKC